MRYCSTDNLRTQMVLAKPLYSDRNRLLLGVGNELNDAYIKRIRELNLSHVHINEKGTEHILIEEIIDEVIVREARRSLEGVFHNIILETKKYKKKNFSDILDGMEKSRYAAPINDVMHSVRLVIGELEEKPEKTWDQLLYHFSPQFCFGHGLEVAMISILLGFKYLYNYDQLLYLGLGAALHDLGMAFMPAIARKRNCDYTPAELEEYENHPHYGGLLMANHRSGHYVSKECLLQHHERQDGEGFPEKRKGNNTPPTSKRKYGIGDIYQYAEIVTVADAFVNLTTGKWQERANSPEEALDAMSLEAGNNLNQVVVSALRRIVVPYPRGASIKIIDCDNGRYKNHYAVIEKPNRINPQNPLMIVYADPGRKRIPPRRVDFKNDSAARIDLDM